MNQALDFSQIKTNFSKFWRKLSGNSKVQKLAACIAVLVLMGIAYLPGMQERELVLHDDQILVGKMEKLQGLQDYSDLWANGAVIDRQPLRDMSYLADWWLTRKTGLWSFKFTQFLIWIACLFFLSKIFHELQVSQGIAFALILWISTHPISPIVVSWLGGRKHLLSCFFILWTTWLWLRKSFAKSIITFALSLLSQPISLLWPIWAFFFSIQLNIKSPQPKDENEIARGTWAKQRRMSLAAAAVLSFAFGVWNWSYYHSPEFLKFFGQAKVLPESWPRFVDRFVIWGRWMIHIFFPRYPQFWPWELNDPLFRNLGILLGIVQVFFSFSLMWVFLPLRKNRQQIATRDFSAENRLEIFRTSGLWVLWGFLPLLVVTIKMTGESGYDTYLIYGLFAWAIAAGKFISTRKTTSQRPALLLIILVAASTYPIFLMQAWAWNSSDGIANRMPEIRRRAFPLMVKAKNILATHPQYEETLKLGIEAFSLDPQEINLGFVMSTSILKMPGLSDTQKLQLFDQYEIPSAWYIHSKVMLLKSMGLDEKLIAEAQKLNALSIPRITYELQEDFERVQKTLCEQLKLELKICHKN